MNALGAFVLVSLILATLQEGSPEISAFEFLTASVLAIVFFWGTIRFLILRGSIPRPLFYLLGFLAWSAINVVIALSNGVEPLWWFRRFFPVLTLPLTALASMTAFRSQRQMRVAFVTLILIGLIVVLQALSQIRSVDLATIANLQDLRRYGGGYYSAFGLCLTIPFLFRRPRLKRPTWLLVTCALAIFFVVLVLSFTRTHWISTTVALLFMVYLLAQIRRVALPVLLAWVAVPTVLILAFLLWGTSTTISGFVLSRVASIPRAFHDLSFVDRIMELQGLWNSATQNPVSILAGNGLGARFTFYSPNPWSWGGTGWIENDYSHNYYAYLLWSTGFVGLSLFLLFWGSLLRQTVKVLSRSFNIHASLPYYLTAICTAVVNLLIASLTGPPLMSFKWAVYFGVLIGIALNLTKLLQTTTKSSSRKCVKEMP